VAVGAGPGDGLVSSDPSVSLAVLTADCAAIALGSPEGVFAAVHAGWRGLVGGVVEEAVRAMRAMGAGEVVGALGPCVHAGCYEFSEDDLATVASRFGDGVRSRTAAGRPALDIPAAVSASLAASQATETAGIDSCTACAGGYFSHRARADTGRQALIVWSAPGSAPT
jgi:polyphenol oxidase